MEFRYGQISENKSINTSVYNCFMYLRERDQKKFVKKFKDSTAHRNSNHALIQGVVVEGLT